MESDGSFVSGLALMRSLADGVNGTSRLLQLLAAGAVANVLQHEALAPLWSDSNRLQYLLEVDELERSRLLGLPSRLHDVPAA